MGCEGVPRWDWQCAPFWAIDPGPAYIVAAASARRMLLTKLGARSTLALRSHCARHNGSTCQYEARRQEAAMRPEADWRARVSPLELQGLVGVVLGGLAYNGYSKQFVHDKEVEEAIKRSYKGEQVTILELEEAAAMWKRKEMDDLNTKLDAAHQEI